MDRVRVIEKQFTKKEIPEFKVGDTVKVLVKIPEGPDKIRLHPFEGVVIARHGSGSAATFTVRKVSCGEGIERVFPVYAPTLDSIKVLRSGKVKRAKLYYLRGKVGKHATKIDKQEKKAEPKPV